MSEKEILFMNPVFTHNIWGGTKLRDVFGYKIEGDDIGECWGIAAHPNGTCTIANGTYHRICGSSTENCLAMRREMCSLC